MTNQKILIVEDDILIADYIGNILNEENFNNFEIANTVDEANEKIGSFQPNVLLLDINIDGEDNGIALAKTIKNAVDIIFITAQNDDATIKRAVQTNPVSYLTKPIKKTDVIAAIRLAFLKQSKNSITIKDGFIKRRLNLNDILYIKSDGNYLDIFTFTNKFTIRNSLDKFLQKIDNPNFCKTHRSYIVNKVHVNQITASSVFVGHFEIPMSRNYRLQL